MYKIRENGKRYIYSRFSATVYILFLFCQLGLTNRKNTYGEKEEDRRETGKKKHLSEFSWSEYLCNKGIKMLKIQWKIMTVHD